MNQIEIRINKHEMMVFDDIEQANGFIDSFTRDFSENIMFSAPKDEHPDYIESTIFFYNPYEEKPQGQEALLLDVHLPK
ncbi:hypothetical protein [Lactococcus kimchii]|uniref:hypothetical protein n=1 Tax=Lactococcus sp. S-13 TaxID=2507158 RepID=UPI001023E006|nr:hypothetical protein [Lactococcus sp. S-13]RZI48957.1 hypothetical protein EQJ87_05595 [Lactococcus sp. S-13]